MLLILLVLYGGFFVSSHFPFSILFCLVLVEDGRGGGDFGMEDSGFRLAHGCWLSCRESASPPMVNLDCRFLSGKQALENCQV